MGWDGHWLAIGCRAMVFLAKGWAVHGLVSHVLVMDLAGHNPA
jgi:hypothetical protein